MGLLKTILFAFGLNVRRYSLLNRVIDIVVSKGRKPYFIQIGANNGVDFDDLFFGVTRHGLNGLAVEPIPDYFACLKNAYHYHPTVTPLRVALHPTAREMTMYRVKPEMVGEAWENGIASFSKNHLLAHGILDESICEESVPCMTFDDLIANNVADASSIDIVAIDTEGFDAEILRMINFDVISPSAIRFESKHMQKSDYDFFAKKLRSLDYRIHEAHGDCTAVKNTIRTGPISYLRRMRLS